MECLTPPLDSVPVEEWFCPECEANNRQSSKPLSYLSKSLILQKAIIAVCGNTYTFHNSLLY